MRESTTKPASETFEPTDVASESPSHINSPDESLIPRLRVLWDQRSFVGRVAASGLAIALALALLLPKRYVATSRLMPPDNQSSSNLAMLAALSNGAGGFGMLASDVLGLKSSGALLLGVLRSRTLQDRLVERFDLKRVYDQDLNQGAREALSDNSSFFEDRKSGIITITVSDRDPQRAAAIANSYTSELNRLVSELATSAARREREFIEQRLETVQDELDAAAKKFSEFASKNVAIDIKEQGRAMVEAAAILQGQMIAAESELEGLRQIYTENNVRVRSVSARVAELKRQLEKLGGIEASRADEENGGNESPYPSIRQLPLLGVTYAELFRNTKIQETVFELLTQQYELAKVQEAKEIPSVKVLDAATVPEKKSFPPRLAIMFLGIFFALMFGMAWVVARARWDELDTAGPAKELARQVTSDVRADLAALSNGRGPGGFVRSSWKRLASRRKSGS